MSRSFCNEIARNSKYVIAVRRTKLISAQKSSSSTSMHLLIYSFNTHKQIRSVFRFYTLSILRERIESNFGRQQKSGCIVQTNEWSLRIFLFYCVCFNPVTKFKSIRNSIRQFGNLDIQAIGIGMIRIKERC